MTERTGLHIQLKVGSTITQVETISSPQPTRDTIDVEELNPTDDIKRKLVGLIDVGEMTFTVNFNPEDATHQALEAALYSGALQSCQIIYKVGYGYSFSGYVTGFAVQEIASGSVMKAEVTVTLTTKPTYGSLS